ncbi:hypothetical protein IMSHALPRED_011075 [Imshaugia aleurites]|uniref:Late endosomal/lysosomal adaptor and MAPK and MTOR activator-domain-containing protein n=1 Tax=Imshaugia aleurites TaxID=172621 RepID=A0A8H3G6W3_9LECA|nr:hypothetical protein IMSHALPRED_011075 [Imshaugia aleurites]
MGACSSCLGFGRRDRGVENLETSRLLYDDPYRSQYGATGQTQHRGHYHQPDPESLRREAEALEGICHDMSESPTLADMQLSDVLDVFTALPQSGQANGNFTSPPTTAADEGTPMASRNDAHTTKKQEPTPQGMMYRSVRTAPSAGHIWKDLNEDPKTLEVAKAVMEGSSERP